MGIERERTIRLQERQRSGRVLAQRGCEKRTATLLTRTSHIGHIPFMAIQRASGWLLELGVAERRLLAIVLENSRRVLGSSKWTPEQALEHVMANGLRGLVTVLEEELRSRLKGGHASQASPGRPRRSRARG